MTVLPGRIGRRASIYLRPVGLTRAGEAASALAAGRARRLAGGPLAFLACEVSLRESGRVERVIVSLEAVEAWAERLRGSGRARVEVLLERLSAPRLAPDGAPFAGPWLMGILNVTPDSFSDGGAHLAPAAALAQAKRLAEEGAAILDVGGESVRPGAAPVAESVELGRVVPVLAALAEARAELRGALVSIDTQKPAVMRAALGAGARIINDVSALTAAPESLEVAVSSEATVVLMHRQGEPRTMNLDPRYEDAALDVFDYLEARIEACVQAGIKRERLIADPGIGFGKRGADNLAILRALALYHGLGVPLLLGVSRKGLTGDLDRARPPGERLPGSLAAAVHALDQGVQLLRVHDVAATRQALEVWERLAGVTEER